uniref:EF-hand domain-containing protein n=1 Tax=Leptobrachium leishanense TaxID=445787 RepID=A0A8C5P719_9ANUR
MNVANKMGMSKEENYALLHNESDVEEFDKSNHGNMKTQQGKTCLRRLKSLYKWTHPQCLCHTILIVILVSSQVALSIFVLTIYMDPESVRTDQALLQKGYPSYTNNMSGSRFESSTQGHDELKKEDLKPDVRGMDSINLLKRIHTLEMNMKSLKRIVSNQEASKTLQARQQAEAIKHENALERQFNNMTGALNSLQNHLEENLGTVFTQISQLRDDIYFFENALNHSKPERFGEVETTQNPTKEGISDGTDLQFTASQTIQILPEKRTTMQPISKLNEVSNMMYRISIPFLKSRTDFQVFFYGADKDANGYLSYDEIKNVLGEEAPSEDILHQFDEDQNRNYSYVELLKAFELQD